MAAAPEALCTRPPSSRPRAPISGASSNAAHRLHVYRHHGRQLARGMFPGDMSCIDWLLAMDPFQLPGTPSTTPAARKAGFA